jgi:hypothetical protein
MPETESLTAETRAPEDGGDDGAVDRAVIHRKDVRRPRATAGLRRGNDRSSDARHLSTLHAVSSSKRQKG